MKENQPARLHKHQFGFTALKFTRSFSDIDKWSLPLVQKFNRTCFMSYLLWTDKALLFHRTSNHRRSTIYTTYTPYLYVFVFFSLSAIHLVFFGGPSRKKRITQMYMYIFNNGARVRLSKRIHTHTYTHAHGKAYGLHESLFILVIASVTVSGHNRRRWAGQ